MSKNDPKRQARAALTSGVMSFTELERILRKLGFELTRTRGSHRIYVHKKVLRPLSIQPKGKDAKAYQMRQLRDMIDEFGLLDDEA